MDSIDDDVYFQKITESQIWGNYFILKNFRAFTQHAAVAVMRHSATMG